MKHVLFLFLLLLPARALAHNAPYSFLNLRFGAAGVEGALTAHVIDLAHERGIAAPESLLAPARAAAEGPQLFRLLAKRLAIVGDGDTLRLRYAGAEPDSERTGVTLRFTADGSPPAEVAIFAQLFPYDATHETYVNAYVGDELRDQDLIDARHTRITFATGAAPAPMAVVRRFVRAGIHHIFIGPDHILFVVGLLLLGGGLRRLLKIVTGFTIAHSITLALATLGWVTPPARMIEPLIALSIVFVAVENFSALRRNNTGRDRRAALAFLFGFVHGFGFASVLREFGLPAQAMGIALFSFNVGVEIGQATIVLLAAPLLAFLKQQTGPRVVWAGSALVGLAGLFWFFQRLAA